MTDLGQIIVPAMLGIPLLAYALWHGCKAIARLFEIVGGGK